MQRSRSQYYFLLWAVRVCSKFLLLSFLLDCGDRREEECMSFTTTVCSIAAVKISQQQVCLDKAWIQCVDSNSSALQLFRHFSTGAAILTIFFLTPAPFPMPAIRSSCKDESLSDQICFEVIFPELIVTHDGCYSMQQAWCMCSEKDFVAQKRILEETTSR